MPEAWIQAEVSQQTLNQVRAARSRRGSSSSGACGQSTKACGDTLYLNCYRPAMRPATSQPRHMAIHLMPSLEHDMCPHHQLCDCSILI
jgi:hypothetical protein